MASAVNPHFSSVVTNDGMSLYVARYQPEVKPPAVIQIVHGFGESVCHYDEMAVYFAQNGFAVVMHDQRGHGEMPGLSASQRKKARGVAEFALLLQDIKTIRMEISGWYKDTPVILLGHSMGGLIAAKYLLDFSQGEYTKAVFETPWLRLFKPLPTAAVSAIKLAGKLSGKIAINTGLDLNAISRDKGKVNTLRTDGIYHTRISLRLFGEITEAGKEVMNNPQKITIPALLLNAGRDRIVCPEAIRTFCDGSEENFRYIEYEDGFHNLHSDIIRGKVLEDMVGFCREYTKDGDKNDPSFRA